MLNYLISSPFYWGLLAIILFGFACYKSYKHLCADNPTEAEKERYTKGQMIVGRNGKMYELPFDEYSYEQKHAKYKFDHLKN